MELSNREGRDRKGHQDRQLGLSSVLVKIFSVTTPWSLSHSAGLLSQPLQAEGRTRKGGVHRGSTPPGKEAEMANARFLS